MSRCGACGESVKDGNNITMAAALMRIRLGAQRLRDKKELGCDSLGI
jgi:hypothetical protein